MHLQRKKREYFQLLLINLYLALLYTENVGLVKEALKIRRLEDAV